jgi:DNA (cytosine-5)-methyltransferase 1
VRTKEPDTTPTAIELFAGVGGFRLGLEATGWSVVWSNQWEPSTKTQHASSCYVANFGPEGHSGVDIQVAIDMDDNGQHVIPDADLIVGGFPCQDYSVAKSKNSALGLEGKKGVLWWQIHRLVASKRPKFVFLENVDRLLKSPSSQRGRDFAVMLRTLGDLGYFIEWRVVNAAEYGFPQKRVRVFIVATRNDLNRGASVDEYFATGILVQALPIVSRQNDDSFDLPVDVEEISNSFNEGGQRSPFRSAGFCAEGKVFTADVEAMHASVTPLSTVLVEDDQVPPEYWIPESQLESWKFLKGAKSIERTAANGHKYFYSEGSMAFPDALDRPARTILTGEGGSSPSRFKHIIKAPAGFRRLLPLELERLNGFPDEWTKYGVDGLQISDAKRAFFMGNALVVGLIELVGIELLKRLNASAAQ